MNYRFKHKLRYINWEKEAKVKETLTQEQFSELLKTLKGRKVTTSKTKRLDFNEGDYRLEKRGIHRVLYLFRKNGQYEIYRTNAFDDKKNTFEDRAIGPKAISLLISKFCELNTPESKKGFFSAFGTTNEEFKNCIPKQFYYKNNNFINKVIKHVSSVDATSHYPSCLMGRLPDSHTAITVDSYAEPTEDYPFAFYLKSGHCAEYGVFNTFDWLIHPFGMYLLPIDGSKNTLRKDETTVLMKASNYTLDETWKYFFERRKIDEECKLVMNAAIGMMHTSKYKRYKYAHLVAIALGRANSKQLKLIDEIGVRNILHVCVDGIIYKGVNEFGLTGEKSLRTYSQEFTDCEIKIKTTNCYIVKKDDCVVKIKHGAFNCYEDGSDITDESIINAKDPYEVMDKWIKVEYKLDI